MAVLVCWLSIALNETVALQQLHQTSDSVHVDVCVEVASWSNTADRWLKKITDSA